MASRARIFRRIAYTLLLLVTAAILFAVLTPWPSRYVHAKVLEYVSDLSGGTVTIGSLEVRLFPPRLILRDVRIETREAGGVEWKFACKEADLLLPYAAYRGRLRRIESVDLLEPNLDYRRHGVAPVAPGEPSTQPFLPISFGRIRLQNGGLSVTDDPSGLSGRLEGVNGSAASTGFLSSTLEGSLEPATLYMRVDEHDLSGKLAGAIRIAGREVRVSDLNASLEGGFAATGSIGLDYSGATPAISADVRGSLEPRATPRPVLRDLSGDAHIQARGLLKEDGPYLRGTLTSGSLTYAGLTLSKVTSAAEYAPDRLELSQVQAEVFDGGHVAGETELVWNEPEKLPDLSATIEVEEASVSKVLAWTGQEWIPVTGRVRHRGTYRLQELDPASLEAEGEVSLVGTLQAGGREPVRGTSRFKVSHGLLYLQPAVATTPTLKATYRGTLPVNGKGAGAGSLDLEASKLERLSFLLEKVPDALRAPAQSIVRESPEARAAYQGEVRWQGTAPHFSGSVSAGPLFFQSVSLGQLTTRIEADADSVAWEELVLSEGIVTANLSGSWRSGGAIRVMGSVGNLPSDWIQQWAGLDYPVAGNVTAEGDVAGTVSHPEGEVTWRMDEPMLASIPFNRAEGRLVLKGEAIELAELRVLRGDGVLSAQGSIGLDGGPLDLQAEGKDLDLRWIYEAGLVPVEISGPVQAHATLKGTMARWELAAVASTPGVFVRGIETGAVEARFTADPAMGALTVVPEVKGMNFTGRILWDKRMSFDGDLLLEDFVLPLTHLGEEVLVSDSDLTLSGGVRVEGFLKGPARFDASGNLVKIRARFGSILLDSQVPTFFRWSSPRLELTPVRLAGSGSDIKLVGVAEPELGTYHFSADGTVALAALASFFPGLQAGGDGTIQASFDMTPEASLLTGWASVSGGKLRGAGLPLAITELDGKVVLDQHNLFHLEDVRFLAGGGTVELEGGGKLRGIVLDSMQLTLKGRDVKLEYPDGFRGRYDMQLALDYGQAGGRLGGDIQLVRGVYSKDFQIERSLFSLAGGQDVLPPVDEEGLGGGAFSAIALDLGIRAERGLWIVNDLARMEGHANLHVGGTVGAPEVTGRVSAFEGSIVKFRQVEYEVTRGNIDLVDIDRFNPYFDIAATTRVQDYDIYLTLDGSLEHLEYQLTSNPSLSQQDILALLVTGSTLQQGSTAASQGALEETAAKALTGGLAQGLGGALQGVTGLDELSIDPMVMGREGDPASRIRVGKQVTENLSAAYSTLLGSSSEEIYQLDYKLGRDFKFTSTRDSDGAIAGDLRYVWRMKTGPGASERNKKEPRRIRTFTVEGDPELKGWWRLKRQFRLEAGDVADRVKMHAGEDRVLQSYHDRGYWQATVEAIETEIEGQPDLVDLTLKVNPGPKVSLEVDGTDKDRKYRRKLMGFWKESVFPEDAPEEAGEKLRDLLRKEGYLKAEVKVDVPVDTPEKRETILTASQGPRAILDRVEIAGNKNFETEELLRVLRSKPEKHDPVDPDEAKVDAGRLRAKYLFAGYPDAKVPPPEIVVTDDGTRATLRFAITEGEPVRIKDIKVEGNTALTEDFLLRAVSLKPGDPYLRTKVRTGAEQIRLAYDRAGFRNAKIAYDLEGPNSAELVYKVEEGTRRYVSDIKVEGNLLTRKETMEKEMTFQAGDPLSQEELLQSQRALYRLGVFQTVELTEEAGPDPEHPVVRVKVSESDNLIQSVGAGYDSQEGIRGLYDITNTNLFGRGRTFSVILRGSAIDSRAQVLLKDPFLFNRKLESLLTGYWARQERESFTEETLGTTLQLMRKHTKQDRTYYRYTIKDVDVSDLQVTPSEAGVQSLRLSGPSFSYTHDSRDDFFNPHKGTFDSFDVSVFDNSLGSDVNYVRFYGLGTWFHKVADTAVWAQALRIGMEFPYRPTDLVPISERFFAGGDTTVRGFERDELGPKDPVTGEPLGGEGLFIVNEEYRFPIWRFLRGVVFVDAGNLASSVSELFPLRMRWVAGTGIRIDTPIGPFRLEYGWKLDREDDESPGEWNFSIGQAF
ncbi:MAG TPA: outer membrane protein assembly factor BamA [Candidatus Polarisedimenticolia bacterium]|nr:outer membrane protein assembly factor BamA [Candidatus Polarisedimenticolia bacterium]